MLCHFCSRNAIKKCSQCQVVCYCDDNCQQKDWLIHKNKCLAWKTNILNWIEQSEEKIMIINLIDKTQRKLIHQCIEKATKTFSRSLKLTSKPSGNPLYRFYNQCPGCYAKYIPIKEENYHRGYEENNQDEYYQINCLKCNYSWTWECNYDDDVVKYVFGNNCVVIGKQMKMFRNSKCFEISKLIISSCPQLPDVSSYNSISFTSIPMNLTGIKKLQQFLDNK